MSLFFLWSVNLLARCLFHSLVVLLVDLFVVWFSGSKKICSTSLPRGNQVDGLPWASSLKLLRKKEKFNFCLLIFSTLQNWEHQFFVNSDTFEVVISKFMIFSSNVFKDFKF